ncbi:Uncharacterised protein [Bordetella pertussis]|nr:Uncharacterised protein [Bordetella pertussis]
MWLSEYDSKVDSAAMRFTLFAAFKLTWSPPPNFAPTSVASPSVASMDKFPPRYWVFCEVERLWLLSKSALIPALSATAAVSAVTSCVASAATCAAISSPRISRPSSTFCATLSPRRVAAVSRLERALAVDATSTLQPELWLVCSLTYLVDSTFLARMRKASSVPAFPFAAPPYRFRLMSAPPISRTLPASTEPPPKLRFALR